MWEGRRERGVFRVGLRCARVSALGMRYATSERHFFHSHMARRWSRLFEPCLGCKIAQRNCMHSRLFRDSSIVHTGLSKK